MHCTSTELNGRTFTMHLWLIAFVIRKTFRFSTLLSPRMKTDKLVLVLHLQLSTLILLLLFRFDLYLGFLRLVLFLLFYVYVSLRQECPYSVFSRIGTEFGDIRISWRRGAVVVTTVQLYSTKSELRFCAGSKPARGVSEIWDGEDLWQWSRLEIRLNTFSQSTIPQKQFIIIIIIIIKHTYLLLPLFHRILSHIWQLCKVMSHSFTSCMKRWVKYYPV